MRRRLRRPVLVALLAALGVAVAVAGVAIGPGRLGEAAPAGPRAWLSVERAGDLLLLRVDLGATASVSVVASRRQARGGGGRWMVEPGGRHHVWVTPGGVTTRLEFLGPDVTEVAWSVDLPGNILESSVWSSDGRFLAATTVTDRGDGQAGVLKAVILDTQRQVVVERVVVPGVMLLGFAAEGQAVVLAEARHDARARIAGWAFQRLDAATGEPVTAGAAQLVTDPRATIPGDVSTRAAAWLASEPILGNDSETREGETLVVRSLGSSAPVELGRVATSYDWKVIRPDGAGAMVGVRDPADPDGQRLSIALIDFDGAARPVWTGPSLPYGPLLGPDGNLALLLGWAAGPSISVLDLASGRSVAIELPAGIADAAAVAVSAGALPDVDRVAWAPPSEPAPTLGTAPEVPGDVLVLASRTTREPDGRGSVTLAWLTPVAGGLASEAVADPIPVGDAELVTALIDPSGDGVVAIVTGAAGATAFRWSGGATTSIPIPADWGSENGIVVRPDGGALATVVGDEVRILGLASQVERSVPVPSYGEYEGVYRSPVGWTRDGAALVVAPGLVCTDFCGFTYPSLVLVDVESGALTPFADADPVDALATGAWHPRSSVHTGRWAWFRDASSGTFELHTDYESAARDQEVAWPANAGRIDERFLESAWSPDGRRLWVTPVIGDRQHVVAFDEPVADRPVATDLGLLPDEYALVTLDDREAWAIGRRAGEVTALVDLATGEAREAPGWVLVGFVRSR